MRISSCAKPGSITGINSTDAARYDSLCMCRVEGSRQPLQLLWVAYHFNIAHFRVYRNHCRVTHSRRNELPTR